MLFSLSLLQTVSDNETKPRGNANMTLSFLGLEVDAVGFYRVVSRRA